MTEKRANEIFKTKYPNGEIRAKNTTSAGSKYWVVFDTNKGKVYEYCNNSYADLLARFGFCILYDRDVRTLENLVSDYKRDLDLGYCYYSLLKKPLTQEEIDSLNKKIAECEHTLSVGIRV